MWSLNGYHRAVAQVRGSTEGFHSEHLYFLRDFPMKNMGKNMGAFNIHNFQGFFAVVFCHLPFFGPPGDV